MFRKFTGKKSNFSPLKKNQISLQKSSKIEIVLPTGKKIKKENKNKKKYTLIDSLLIKII